MAETPDATATATTGGYSPLTPAAVGGKRRRKLHMVTRKVARKFLRKHGMKMRGGEGDDGMGAPAPAPAPETSAGRRRKSAKRSASTRRRRASAPFGF